MTETSDHEFVCVVEPGEYFVSIHAGKTTKLSPITLNPGENNFTVNFGNQDDATSEKDKSTGNLTAANKKQDKDINQISYDGSKGDHGHDQSDDPDKRERLNSANPYSKRTTSPRETLKTYDQIPGEENVMHRIEEEQKKEDAFETENKNGDGEQPERHLSLKEQIVGYMSDQEKEDDDFEKDEFENENPQDDLKESRNKSEERQPEKQDPHKHLRDREEFMSSEEPLTDYNLLGEKMPELKVWLEQGTGEVKLKLYALIFEDLKMLDEWDVGHCKNPKGYYNREDLIRYFFIK